MAEALLDLWYMVCLRRNEFSHGEMVPQPNLQDTENPNLRLLWSVAARDIVRARRQWQRANFSRLLEARGPLTSADETVFQVPSEDGTAPEIRGSFSFADSA